MEIKFGVNSTDVDAAAAIIGRALNLIFKAHESSFYGGAYCRADVHEGVILVRPNLDPLDNGPLESDWPTEQVLLSMDVLSEDVWVPYINALRKLSGIEITRL